MTPPGTNTNSKRNGGRAGSAADARAVNGPRFTGEITIDKQYAFAVAGQATRGQIVFTTERKGLAQQTFEGRMSKERMELLFLAISAKGEKKKGTVSLALRAK